MRNTLNKIIVSASLSFLLFGSFDISWLILLSIFITIWLLIFINFDIRQNREFYVSLLVITSTIYLSYSLTELYVSGEEAVILPVENVEFWAIFLLLFVIWIVLELKHPSDSNKKSQTNQIIMEKRQKDLDLLQSYLNRFSIVGINGRWGTGKSFVIERLKEQIHSEYEIIEIDLMTSNMDEILPSLITKLEEVLYQNRILPKYSNKVKKNITSLSFLSKLHGLTNLIFTDTESSSELIKKFKDELAKLGKKVLIIYEDLDRISNEVSTKKIFAISEKLACDHIKIIYQYHEDAMEIKGFTPDFLEKYIPYKINLTELGFWEILHFNLENNKTLSLEDFGFLDNQRLRFNVLSEFLSYGKEMQLSLGEFPIRKVKQMVEEVSSLPQLMQGKYSPLEKEAAIGFFIVKHLDHSIYKCLSTAESPLKSLKFFVNEKYYTIFELIELLRNEENLDKQIDNIFSNQGNKRHYGILKLFGYEIVNKAKFGNQVNAKNQDRRARHNNEKIDRIIWNLLFAGKSDVTNAENFTAKFKEIVLSEPAEEQKEAFYIFENYFFNQNKHITEHSTLFKIGIQRFLNLFEAFKIANDDPDSWIYLIEFYFSNHPNNEFDLNTVRCLNFIPLQNEHDCIRILKKINNLKVTGNMIEYENFHDFLKKYFRALHKMNLVNAHRYFDGIENLTDKEEKQKHLLIRLNEIAEDLNCVCKTHQERGLESTPEHLLTIESFILKMIVVLKSERSIKETGAFDVPTEINAALKIENKAAYEELEALKKTEQPKSFIRKVDEYYQDQKISFYEVNQLIRDKEIK